MKSSLEELPADVVVVELGPEVVVELPTVVVLPPTTVVVLLPKIVVVDAVEVEPPPVVVVVVVEVAEPIAVDVEELEALVVTIPPKALVVASEPPPPVRARAAAAPPPTTRDDADGFAAHTAAGLADDAGCVQEPNDSIRLEARGQRSRSEARRPDGDIRVLAGVVGRFGIPPSTLRARCHRDSCALPCDRR